MEEFFRATGLTNGSMTGAFMDDGWGRSPADNMVPDRDGNGITLWLQGLDWGLKRR